MENIEMENSINNNLVSEKEQKNFLETKLGNTINKGFNIGLRYLLPDLIEDQFIEVKDSIIKNGLKEGIKKAIDSATDLGKSAMGIATGKFENIKQVQNAVKKGGIIDTLEDVIDKAVSAGTKKGLIPTSIGKVIKKGKETILNTVSNNIENEFEAQLDSIEKLDKYSNNWKNYYANKDFDGMEKEYNKMQEKLGDIIPLEKTIKEARTIENLHNLIKNNGKSFNLTDEEIELANII